VGRFPTDLCFGETTVVGLPRGQIDRTIVDDCFQEWSDAPRMRMGVNLLAWPNYLHHVISCAKILEPFSRNDCRRFDLTGYSVMQCDASRVEFAPQY